MWSISTTEWTFNRQILIRDHTFSDFGGKKMASTVSMNEWWGMGSDCEQRYVFNSTRPQTALPSPSPTHTHTHTYTVLLSY